MNSFKEMRNEAQQHPEYWVNRSILGVVATITREMERQKITRTELAEKLGTSPAHVSKMLNGNPNLTIKSMVKVARALNCHAHIHIDHDQYVLQTYRVPLMLMTSSPKNTDIYTATSQKSEPGYDLPLAA